MVVLDFSRLRRTWLFLKMSSSPSNEFRVDQVGVWNLGVTQKHSSWVLQICFSWQEDTNCGLYTWNLSQHVNFCKKPHLTEILPGVGATWPLTCSWRHVWELCGTLQPSATLHFFLNKRKLRVTWWIFHRFRASHQPQPIVVTRTTLWFLFHPHWPHG